MTRLDWCRANLRGFAEMEAAAVAAQEHATTVRATLEAAGGHPVTRVVLPPQPAIVAAGREPSWVWGIAVGITAAVALAATFLL